MSPSTPSNITLRNTIQPGDLGRIVALHGTLYAAEYWFDAGFEAYVAGPLAEFVIKAGTRDRIWIAEQEAQIVGCMAIVEASKEEAQLRWFLVAPSCRGAGLGHRLITAGVDFCRAHNYRSIFLWTVGELTQAARLYARNGFTKVEQHPRHLWGRDLMEQKYVLPLESSYD